MNRSVAAAAIVASCVLGAPGVSQDQKPPKSESGGAQDPMAEMLATFARAGIEFDKKAETVTVPATVGIRDQPLEFILINRRGKAHEAMFVTEVKASLINAALIALGYQPGENARFVDKDPRPTEEELRNGAELFEIVPPKGMNMWFTVSWTVQDESDNDVEREHPIEDLLLDGVTGEPIVGASWVYLGSMMAPLYRGDPPVFVADYEGNLFSCVYKTPASHLATLSHERAANDQVWWFTETVPPAGSKVRFTIHKRKPKLVIEREKRLEKSRDERGDGKDKKQNDD